MTPKSAEPSAHYYGTGVAPRGALLHGIIFAEKPTQFKRWAVGVAVSSAAYERDRRTDSQGFVFRANKQTRARGGCGTLTRTLSLPSLSDDASTGANGPS